MIPLLAEIMNDKPTILLVEDSENDRFLMRAAFKMAKCDLLLHEVHNGEQALAYLQGDGPYADRMKYPLPTVMLLDLNMPKMNGFDVLVWARAHPVLQHLPITILTASIRGDDVKRSFDLGASSFLVKPSSLDSLSAMMRCLCDWIQINHFPPLTL